MISFALLLSNPAWYTGTGSRQSTNNADTLNTFKSAFNQLHIFVEIRGQCFFVAIPWLYSVGWKRFKGVYWKHVLETIYL